MHTKIFIIKNSIEDEKANQTFEAMKEIVSEDMLNILAYSGKMSDAFNLCREICLDEKANLMVVRAGFIPNTACFDFERHVEQLNQDMVISPTLMDRVNQSVELTAEIQSGFPIIKYASGYHQSDAIRPVNCFDHNMISVPYRALLDVGQFDTALKEFFILTDYTLRCRWAGFEVGLDHGLGFFAPEKMNLFTENCIFISEEKKRDELTFKLDQQTFHRKYTSLIKTILENI
jgi:hypothetical protein